MKRGHPVRVEERLEIPRIDAPPRAEPDRRQLPVADQAAHMLLAGAQPMGDVRHLQQARRQPMTTDKFCCANCGAWKSRVVDSRPDRDDALRYLRWRHCAGCHQLFETAEQATGRTMKAGSKR
jgi:hypothetical protein